MARNATLKGRIRIGGPGVTPTIDKAISINTPDITDETIILKNQAESTTVILDMGGVTNALLVDLSFKDDATGLVREAEVKFNGLTDFLPPATRVIISTNDTGAGVTSIEIKTAASNGTDIEGVIAGV